MYFEKIYDAKYHQPTNFVAKTKKGPIKCDKDGNNSKVMTIIFRLKTISWFYYLYLMCLTFIFIIQPIKK